VLLNGIYTNIISNPTLAPSSDLRWNTTTSKDCC